MRPTRNDDRAKKVIAALIEQGWTVELTKKCHLRCVPPDRARPAVIHSGSPSKPSAFANWLALLRRSGYRG